MRELQWAPKQEHKLKIKNVYTNALIAILLLQALHRHLRMRLLLMRLLREDVQVDHQAADGVLDCVQDVDQQRQ